MKKTAKSEMPDVTSHSSSIISSTITWVGMDVIELPIQFYGQTTLAKVDVHVNVLDPSAKGIHMSRLYVKIGEIFSQKNLSVDLVRNALSALIESQGGLADSAKIRISWRQPMLRKALLSEYEGWKGYPFHLEAQKIKDQVSFKMGFSLLYSSTCPCSAALARQLKEKEFLKHFSDRALKLEEISNWIRQTQVSSPHSQRSRSIVHILLNDSAQSFDFEKYIDALEGVLKTPVQTAVKREDEQEFARLNGENLMFVEDALRKMKTALDNFSEIKDFKIKAEHLESLHAHNATGVIRKRDR
ncbi:MAG: GTP cyclohydrolase FolE2 [Bdellovibrionales bacterium]|nr:GTP cyclohydrolase FolE2 [Bdellovibrionales bacterium]